MLNVEVIDKIEEMSTARIDEIDGRPVFVNSKGVQLIKIPPPEIQNLFSLTQLVNFIKMQVESDESADKYFVNVDSYHRVSLHQLAYLTDSGSICTVATADFSDMYAGFKFGEHKSQEQFIIDVMTKFQDTDERKKLLAFVSSVRAEKIKGSIDDGFSQSVAVKAGVSLVESKSVQNLWVLTPFMTFPEVHQPKVPYMLRLHQRDDELPKFALYECDGGLWRVNLTIDVREYLKKEIVTALGEKANLVTVL